MANTTWTQSAGMVSDEDTDNLESYADQAEASKDAAAVSAAAAEAAKVAAAASEAAALASKNSAATSATTATSGAATATAKASEAAASATSASTSATEAQTAQTAAEAAETAAAASEAAVASSVAAASTSETNAATSAAAASTSEANAATSETNAATSATTSTSSATASAASASAASASETNAAASETAAAASETAAATSETNAATSATSADGSASAASTSASNAATSESNAASSASAASTSETNAAASEAAASTSEANAATSETNAANSATASATSATASAGSAAASASSATAAAASETAAAASEGNAATSATSAATSATNAAASATSTATSESNAASSEASAAGSAASAEAAYDNFDDRYLGAKASAPTLDNDGDPLITGALYFNTIDESMKVYDGSAWLDAYASLSGTLLKSGGTMTGDLFLNVDPTSALQAATKQYVDVIAAASLHYHDPVRVESPVDLSSTYNNGTNGVGATLTNSGTQVALTVDGVTLSVNDRVLMYNQANSAHNGIYEVTDAGSASTNWVMTRAPDADTYAVSDPASLGQGDAFFVKEGATGAGELYVMNTAGEVTFGTTGITFTQISSAAVYTAGTGVTLNGTQINIGQAVGAADSPTFAAISVTGNVDGRNVSADGTKLDTIETNADVTDTANVTAAGALMDSEVTNLAQVKAFSSADYATAAQGALADSAIQAADLATVATTGAYSDLTGTPAPYADADVDTHLNTGTAATGEYLSWNGADYDWATVPAGYADADVDTHLNTGTATTDQFLSWTGADYDWVDAGGGFPTGTLMLFQQTSAPTGWTKQTTHNDKALRVVSGTAGSGGNSAFTTIFANRTSSSTAAGGTVGNTSAGGTVGSTSAGGTVGSTTLSSSQMPSHNHRPRALSGGGILGLGYQTESFIGGQRASAYNDSYGGVKHIENTGGGGSHNHSFSGASHSHTFSGSSHNHSFSGSSHSHTLDMRVQYVDLIIARKD